MMIFVIGGVKGGKSMLAQCAAKYLSEQTSLGKLYYLATMISRDSEDDKRIDRHIKDRENWGFETIEEGCALPNILHRVSREDVILLDSVTAYVQNNIFSDNDAVNQIDSQVMDSHILALRDKVKHLIIVSDYIFSDAIQYNETTEMYKEILGTVHCNIAANSDIVIECAYSNMKFWKNKSAFDFKPVLDHYYGLSSHLEYKDI